MLEIFAIMFFMIFLTIVVGAIRGTLSAGVVICMILGVIVPGLSLISLIMVFAKPSRNAREMRAAMKQIAAKVNVPAVEVEAAKASRYMVAGMSATQEEIRATSKDRF
jgi:hypothetical protein